MSARSEYPQRDSHPRQMMYAPRRSIERIAKTLSLVRRHTAGRDPDHRDRPHPAVKMMVGSQAQ